MTAIPVLKAEILDDWAALGALESQWAALLRQSRADCIFLTWEWIQAWREVMGDSVRPIVIAVRDESGVLAGVAPFYLTGLSLGGVLHYRTLRVIGDYYSGGEYSDWIVRKDCEKEAALAIAVALAGISDRWDCMWIPNVPGWTGARQRILEACRAVGFHCHDRDRVFSAADIPSDFPSFLASLSGNARSMINRKTKHVFGVPETTFEQCRSEEERKLFLEMLFELNHRRWSAEGQVGTFLRKPLEAQFYRSFTRLALPQGWLALFALRTRGVFQAIQIGYIYNRTFHQLQEGFDPDALPGIGNVLRAKVIELLIREGIRTYDFLGGFTEHKRRWLAQERTGHDLFIGHGGLRNAILFFRELWPTGRFLRPTGLPTGAPIELQEKSTPQL